MDEAEKVLGSLKCRCRRKQNSKRGLVMQIPLQMHLVFNCRVSVTEDFQLDLEVLYGPQNSYPRKGGSATGFTGGTEWAVLEIFLPIVLWACVEDKKRDQDITEKLLTQRLRLVEGQLEERAEERAE